MNDIKQDDGSVVYGGKVYRKPSEGGVKFRIYVLYAAFLLFVGATFGPWGIVAAIGFYLIGKLGLRSEAKRAERELKSFTEACTKWALEYKPEHSDKARGMLLGLAEADARLAVQLRAAAKDTWQQVHIDVKKILNVELAVNDQAVYKAGPAATLAGAAVGGLMFGGFGAVVGALSTGRAGAGKIDSMTLKLRMDDLNQPMLELPFILAPLKASSDEARVRMALAEKWTNLIHIMRHRTAQAIPAGAPAAQS